MLTAKTVILFFQKFCNSKASIARGKSNVLRSSERGDNIAHMLRCYIVNLGGNLVDLHYGHN